MTRSDVSTLLSPFALGQVHLRNRVFVPGHTTNFGHADHPTERHAAYHGERARGGVGLIITEGIRVHPTSAGRHIGLGSFDDSSIPHHVGIAESVQVHGTRMYAQLLHTGRQAAGDATRTAAWSPDLPMGIRIGADEFLPGGLTPPDMAEIVGRLRREFPLLYVHVSHAAHHGSYSLGTQMADMSFRHARFRHHAALFKAAFPDLPVLAVCRLDSLPEAADLVAAGEADLVGPARPHIAELDGFDDVVVAAGARSGERELPYRPPVFDILETVAGLGDPDSPLRGTVLVRDDQGTWAASSVAESLAREGARVHVLSPTASFASRITTYSRLALTSRMGELGIRSHLVRDVAAVRADTVALRDTLCGHTEELTGVTAVVDVSGGRAGRARSRTGSPDVALTRPAGRAEGDTGTDPEELFAAGYAACFGGALGVVERRRRVTAGPVTDTASGTLGTVAAGAYAIAVRLTVTAPECPQKTLEELVALTHTIGPYSKAVRGDIEVITEVAGGS
ncbi:Ohr family peroxiredoxin [Streptomyces sp. NPDC091387]|uniref:Ohr family peroxiredoxin n=1 Tax=Streptomyces sp. NPDC091387 TaxID=3365998 RepID=UPI00380685E3